MIRVALDRGFDAFRTQARALLVRDVRPADVLWDDSSDGQQSLFGEALQPSRQPPDVHPASDRPPAKITVPARFIAIAQNAVYHRDPNRFALAYRVLYRLTHGERELLEHATDPDVLRLRALSREVEHCVHHVHAFVRFRRIETAEGECFVAFYRPEHPVLPLAAPFFERRFASMRWAIFTPEQSAAWDGMQLRYGPGVARDDMPSDDALEDLFRVYYASIFNPARVNSQLLRQRLPPRHWATLPEADVLHGLVHDAGARVQLMRGGTPSASEAFLPEVRELPVLRAAAASCTACPLFEHATQTVFGEGNEHAAIVMVGEQPGDEEDRVGRPFVGPAGEVLARALAAAGIERDALYVTNAVKHFKWLQRGKKRLHSRPDRAEQLACLGWLRAELEVVRPRVIVCLGATAAQAVLGRKIAVTRERGPMREARFGAQIVVTYHPAAILRMPDEAARAQAQLALEQDLRAAAALAG